MSVDQLLEDSQETELMQMNSVQKVGRSKLLV
jgi:hypothetical protein